MPMNSGILVGFITRSEPQYLVGWLWVGREFQLIEGAKTIGSGGITAMLNFDAHVEEYLQRKARRD